MSLIKTGLNGVYLPSRQLFAKSQVGVIQTDGSADLSTTTTAVFTAGNTALALMSTTGFSTDVVTLPGGGYSGADAYPEISLVVSATRFDINQNSTATDVASGATVTRWNRLDVEGMPRNFTLTERGSGNRYEWNDQMPDNQIVLRTPNSYSVVAVGCQVMCNAIFFAPGILSASSALVYDIVINY